MNITAKLGVGGLIVLLGLAACGQREIVLTGERLDLRADLNAEDPAAGSENQSLPISLPAEVNLADWTHRGSGPDHRLPHAAFSSAPQLVWSAPIGQGEGRKYRITADPVVADGRVFTVDSRAQVSAHSTSGAPLWSRNLAPSLRDADDASGAGLAVAGGRLYISTAFGEVVALQATTGAELWRQDLDAAAAGTPTIVGDQVFVVARDGTAWAIEAETGKVQWTLVGTPSVAGVGGGAAPAVADNLVVFPFASRELIGALRGGGTQLWVSNVAGSRLGRTYASISDVTGDPVIVGETLYAGSPTGRTNAFSLRDGNQIWSAKEGAMSPPLVVGGSVFVVSDLAELVRLDGATGDRIWAERLPFFRNARVKRRRGVDAHFGPILAGGRVWVASTDGLLRGFAPEDGSVTASVGLPGGAATNPVIANRTLYVVSKDGQLLAFR